jgi:hypothetical protein
MPHRTGERIIWKRLIDHLRGDINKIEDPKAQALFETTAEVISGLDTAFNIMKRKARTPGSRVASRNLHALRLARVIGGNA